MKALMSPNTIRLNENYLKLREAKMSDVKDIQELYNLNGFEGHSIPWETELENRIFEFPEGELVVEDLEYHKVVGYVSLHPLDSQTILFNESLRAEDLWRVKGDEVTSLLLRRIFLVHPRANERNCTILLDRASKSIAKKYGCKYLYIISRVPGYESMAKEISFKHYLNGLKNQEFINHNVSLWLQRNYELMGGLENYREGDRPSNGCAVLLRWSPPKSLFTWINAKRAVDNRLSLTA